MFANVKMDILILFQMAIQKLKIKMRNANIVIIQLAHIDIWVFFLYTQLKEKVM